MSLLNSIPLHLIATSENYLQMPLIKLVRGFSVQILFSIIAGKCPILLVLTLRHFIFFFKNPILKTSARFCSWVQDELQ